MYTKRGAALIAEHIPSELLKLQKSLDIGALRAEGIEVVRVGPTRDGYLFVGVTSDVLTAQAALDAKYGADTIRVGRAERGVALPYSPGRSSR